MLPLWITFTIGCLALLIASITDFQKREVPDFLSYTLIAVGLAVASINSVFSASFWPLLTGICGLGAGYLVAAFFFYTGQWGGGDAKILMGLGALHGLSVFGPESIFITGNWPMLATLIIAIFILGSGYSLLYFFTMLLIKIKAVTKELQQVNKNPRFKYLRYSAFAIILFGILFGLVIDGQLGLLVLFLGLVIGGGAILIILARIMQNNILVKKTPVNKLVPGDWPVEDIMYKDKKLVEVGKIGLTEKELKIIRESPLQFVTVKEGIPFIPGMFLGYLSIVIFGNWVPYLWAYIIYFLGI